MKRLFLFRYLLSIFFFPFLSGAISSAVVLDQSIAADENWRPKDGIYGNKACAGRDKDSEEDVVVIDLSKKSIAPFEQQCTITRLTDVAPDIIKLDVACTDVSTDKPFPEIFILKKVDRKNIFLRETQERKFTRPGLKMAYCSDEQQQAYLKSQRKSK